MAFSFILFDWDGTLYDSVEACYEVYQEIFSNYGIAKVSLQEFKDGFHADYRRYYLEKGVPEEKLDEVDELWRKLFARREASLSLLPGVEKGLEALSEKGVEMALVSNAEKERVTQEAKALGVLEHFKAIVTKDEVGVFKPSPEGILFALKELGAEKKKALYVGDMIEDIQAGKRAGVATAGIGTGVHSIKLLAKSGADFLVNDVNGVLELV